MNVSHLLKAALLITAAWSTLPPAHAGDLAPAFKSLAQPYDLTRCGAYFGINSMLMSSSVNGTAVAPGTQVQQGAIGGTVGYGCPINAANGSFWFVEGLFDIANLNGNVNGLSKPCPSR